MKDMLKNPVFYYLVIPVLVGIWPLLLFASYLPNAKEQKLLQVQKYEEANEIMKEILTLAPERIEVADVNQSNEEFDYNRSVFEVANQCKISQTKFELLPRPSMITGGQETQTANIKLNQIDIQTFAQFQSSIESKWPNLQCTKVTLNYEESLKDVWNITLDYKYHF